MRLKAKSLAWYFLVLCSLIFFVKGLHDETRAVHSIDFEPVYAGSRCLVKGCNPYDGPQLRAEYLRAGGTVRADGRQLETGSANYPPSALFLILPLGMLSWGPAHIAWLFAIGVCMIVATLLIARLCVGAGAPVALAGLGIFLAGDTWLLLLAQPAGVAIGICAVGVGFLLDRRWPIPGVVCFALSLAIKPQLGAFLWLYFVVEPTYRRRAIEIFGTTLALCLPGVVWVSVMPASRHWFRQLTHVISAVAHDTNTSLDTHAIHFVHMQPLLSLYSNRSSLNDTAVWSVVLLLLLACLAKAWRVAPSRSKDLCALAAISSLSLLPVYHRDHDTRLLIVAFPAIALLLGSQRLLGWLALMLATLLGVVTSPFYISRIDRWQVAQGADWSRAQTVVFMRPSPILVLMLSVTFVWALLRVTKTAPKDHAVKATADA
jgi:hypothetical protein